MREAKLKVDEDKKTEGLLQGGRAARNDKVEVKDIWYATRDEAESIDWRPINHRKDIPEGKMSKYEKMLSFLRKAKNSP